MKKYIVITLGVIAALLIVAGSAVAVIGPASPLGVSGSSLAKQMQDTGWGTDSKDKLTDVACVKKSTRLYACMGTYAMDPANVPSTDSDLNDTDLAGPRPMSYEVIVGFDGMWIASPTTN